MSERACTLSVVDGVGQIVFDRPASLNAMNAAFMNGILESALRVSTDPAIRVVTFRGEGNAFSAGGDVSDMAGCSEAERQTWFLRYAGILHEAIGLFVRSGKPMIAGVQGVAAGAGFSLALACDLVVASEDARFTMAYTKMGLTPDGGGSFFLPRVVGHHRAMELILTNRVLSAEEAQDWGIVNRVCAREALAANLQGLAAELAAGPAAAFRSAKQLIARDWLAGLEQQLQHERLGIAGCSLGEEFRTRMAAFLAKQGAGAR